jgi:hypothetical protein
MSSSESNMGPSKTEECHLWRLVIWICENSFLNYIVFSFFLVAPTFEHWASVKRFVLLQFLNHKTVGRTPWTGDQPITRSLPTQTQNRRRYTSMSWVGFEPTSPLFERAKTVRVLDYTATLIAIVKLLLLKIKDKFVQFCQKFGLLKHLHDSN